MSNKMLIDATHPEETRVVVVRDKRVEDFDFEAASRKPLRGNIYLAKVTRVEPSLQAAFVDFGGNRHGFLAFSEIHPDYYQIPQADRAALLAEERASAEEAEEAPPEKSRRRRRSRSGRNGDSRTAASTGSEDAAARSESVETGTAEDDENGAARSDGDDGETRQDGGDDDADAAGRRAATAAASVHSASDAGVVASDLAATAPEREAEVEAAAAGEDPSALSRAAEQVAETVDSAVEAADVTPSPEGEKASEPEAASPEERAAPTPASATDPQTEGADTVPGTAAGESGTDGDDSPPPPRRRRTRKSAEGLADPQVSEADESEARAERRGEGEDEGEEDNGENGEEGGTVTSLGNSDVMEEIPERHRASPRRQYKIQEVIKRRQIILVQVVKEERGTKGAALTTYLSLAGRYCVLMPNTDRGGGVSRKITDSTDRKRLKELVSELDVPEGMGVILRTAGAARTKTEIRRDFEYLLRLWENVRELTLKSIAPKLVYEEGNLVKRAIRDLYSKEIDEILVAGEGAYREAKDFMRMLMPSHAKNVKLYREPTPIFTAYQIESQLDAMFSPQVTLPSKGYIVINPTEALVAIDVNSGRSTKESSIEETALKTNLEAADEVARQLRLRDLAGLIVIDFIDMDDKRHNRQVEKRLKDALKLDRSRIQVGRISPFGLLEMSRQRIRQGMVETSMVPCPACSGTGQVRSTPSVALYCLRTLEDYLLRNSGHNVTLKTSAAVALYILNQKRSHLNALEERFGLEIGVDADENISGQHLEIVKGAAVERAPGEAAPIAQIAPDAVAADEEEDEAEDERAAARAETEADADAEEAGETSATGERPSRRKRRRRRRPGGAEPREAGTSESGDEERDEEVASAAADDESGEDADAARRSRRRRGRRGGRRHRREGEGEFAAEADDGVEDEAGPPASEPAAAAREEGESREPSAPASAPEPAASPEAAAVPAESGEPEAPAPAHVVHVPIAEGSPQGGTGAPAQPAADADANADADAAKTQEPPAPPAAQEAAAAANENAEVEPKSEPASPAAAAEDAGGRAEEDRQEERRPRRVGWWQRRSFF